MKEVQSFDLFDTLLGRLHYYPKSTFELVEEFYPFLGFKFFRMLAEYKSNKTFRDIYDQFRQLTGITEADALALMQFEYSIELSHIFPIIENLNLVKKGDLIVSDTYYDEDQIRGILEKIGLKETVHVYATPNGKSEGFIWDEIQKDFKVISHLGDSLHSDVNMAQSSGINGVHYTDSQLSSHEQTVLEMGQLDLAFLMRALRLQNPFAPNSPEYLIWNEQCQFNIPLLIQACIHLDQFCQKKKKHRILFTTRDSCLWVQLFRALYPHYQSIDFHTSRHTYRFPSPSFIEYVKGVCTGDEVIVDVHGSGCNFQMFFNQYFNKDFIYLTIISCGSVSALNKNFFLNLSHDCQKIEMLNYDLIGTLYDIRNGIPLRAEPEYDLSYVRPNHLCIAKCIELLPSFVLNAPNLQIIDWAIKMMDLGLTLEKYVSATDFHFHFFTGEKVTHVHVLEGENVFSSESILD